MSTWGERFEMASGMMALRVGASAGELAHVRQRPGDWECINTPLNEEETTVPSIPKERRVEKHPGGTWEEFEAWIRETIGSDLRWRIRPQDTRSNRKMVADLPLGDIERNDGLFPNSNAFVEMM